MSIALLIMGLIPLIFLPDFLGHDDDEAADQNPIDTPDISNINDDLVGGDDDAQDGAGDEDAQDGAGDEDAPIETDPDTGDDNTDLPENQDILKPINDIDLPDDGGQDVDWDTVLGPIDSDDHETPSDGNEGDILLPIDDFESNENEIWLDLAGDSGLDHVEVKDFVVGQDILHISIPPSAVTGNLDYSVNPSDDGQDGLVVVEQQLMAVLKGAPDATNADVFVEIDTISA